MKIIILMLVVSLGIIAKANDSIFDTNLAQNAVAVVRVKLILADNPGPATQFRTYLVHTIRIIKNDSRDRFLDLSVRAFKGRPGVPKEECTIYLQRYDDVKREFSTDKDYGYWILAGGDASNGVSNVSSKVLNK